MSALRFYLKLNLMALLFAFFIYSDLQQAFGAN
jgi:hypothetical protein